MDRSEISTEGEMSSNKRVERNLYMSRFFDIDNFIISLLLYDKVQCDVFTFIYNILSLFDKKYHFFLLNLDCIELWSPIKLELIDEGGTNVAYIGHWGYTQLEFESFMSKIMEKVRIFKRENVDIDFMTYLMMDENGEQRRIDWLELYDVIKIIKSNYYTTTDVNFITSALALEGVHLDMKNNDVIFEINRFPKFSDDIKIDNFNLEGYISLREKEGSKLLREVIFKDENYNHPEELLKEYNDIILRKGIYDNKRSERRFWGLSNGLSLAGIFSGDINLTVAITAASILAGNKRMIYKSANDKLEEFIKKDLIEFINSL